MMRATLMTAIVSMLLVSGCKTQENSSANADTQTQTTSTSPSAGTSNGDSVDIDVNRPDPGTAPEQSGDDANVATGEDKLGTPNSDVTAPVADGEPIDISFDDIDLPIDADMVFRPFMMTDRARELDGKRVRINGYMLADAETRGIKEFILLKNTECKFGPGGQADHLVNVKVKIENGVIYRTEPVSIEGIITINPFNGFDGNTWSIFDLACERLTRYKPRR